MLTREQAKSFNMVSSNHFEMIPAFHGNGVLFDETLADLA